MVCCDLRRRSCRGSSRPTTARSSRRTRRARVSNPAACWSAARAGAERGVDRTVEDEPADPVREQLGVRRAELGAVGRAEVVHPSTRPAPPAGCPCRGPPRRSRRGRPARPTRAAQPRPSRCCCRRNAAISPGVAGRGRRRGTRRTSASLEAVDRRAVAGAARVEADDVEVLEQRVAEDVRRPRGVRRARRARAARVDHQRADPRPGRRHLEHVQLDRRARPAWR